LGFKNLPMLFRQVVGVGEGVALEAIVGRSWGEYATISFYIQGDSGAGTVTVVCIFCYFV